MIERINFLEKSFECLLNKGMGSSGIRLIDHGICSGLLLLLSSTFYFNVFFSLKNHDASNEYESFLKNKFINREIEYNALHWWNVIVWATAAAAIHNVQQNNIDGLSHLDNLNIDDDPLAYLGVLVDILQVWDRTSVRREKTIWGDLPIQGTDINLSLINNKIEIDYNDVTISETIKEDLDFALIGWDKLLEIKP